MKIKINLGIKQKDKKEKGNEEVILERRKGNGADACNRNMRMMHQPEDRIEQAIYEGESIRRERVMKSPMKKRNRPTDIIRFHEFVEGSTRSEQRRREGYHTHAKEMETFIPVEPEKELEEETEKFRRKGANSQKIGIIQDEEIPEERKEKPPQRAKKKPKRVKDYHVLFTLMSVLAVASVYFAIKSKKGLEEESYAAFGNMDASANLQENAQSSVQEEVTEQDSSSSNKDTNPQETKQQTTKATTNKQSTTQNKSNTAATTPKVVPLSFAKPVNGEIQKIYSNDKVIYSKTLELWKTHEGIDMKADIGTIVKSMEKGTVEKVYSDSFYGMTVVIDHGQGYKSSYSNLDENVLVKEKQVIVKGAKLGKVGNTAIGEIKDDPHVHVSVMKDNVIIDPTSVMK